MPPARSHSSPPPAKLRLTFAQNVRMARIHKGMSQERLALESGLDRTFIASLEQGIRNISVDNIEVIATALRIPPHEMLSPSLAVERGYDPTIMRVPRSASSHSVKRPRKRARP
ncbi:helix-turn-helix transcriptional regulator [Variovorax paradoxus]|nr:helix-turn-helix transcriptional regulator [Variovorax paradoxus]